MKALALFALTALLACGCSKQNDAKSTEKGGNPLTAPADYVGAINQAQKTAIKTVDLAYLKNAIALFHGQEDRYPKDLAELVQGRYIQQIPAVPAGSRVVYNPANGEVSIVRQ